MKRVSSFIFIAASFIACSNHYIIDDDKMVAANNAIQKPADNSSPTINQINHKVSAKILSSKELNNCPNGMVYVAGNFCTKQKHICKTYLDKPTDPFARCKEYYPTVCEGSYQHKEFCFDKNELTLPGNNKPEHNITWYQAKSLCESQGKRLCEESEWDFACQGGEKMQPYFGGLTRPSDKCNFDVSKGLGKVGHLNDLGADNSAFPECKNDLGIHNCTGNYDEWVIRDETPGKYRSALKGGWWSPIRANTFSATVAHPETYSDIQVSARCCANSK